MEVLDAQWGKVAYDTAVTETKEWLEKEVSSYKEEGNDEYNRAIDDVLNALKGLYKGQPT